MKAVGSHALVSILQEFIRHMVLFTVNMVPTSACFFILLASHSMLLRQNGAEAGSTNEADDTSLLEQTKLKIFALEAKIKADCVNWPELLGNLPPTSAIVGKRNTNVDLTQQVINIQDAQQLYGDMTALYRNCSRGPKPKNCPSEPCYNGGSCIDDALGSVTCVCTSGFTGKKCQTALTPVRNCPSEPCYNGGTCIDDAFGSVTCVCRPGYTGKKCQTSMTPVRNCPSEPCYNGGTCIDDAFGSVTCVCRPGYTGKKCQTSMELVRNCPSEPCYNGGTCIDDAFGSVTCVCRPGYTGKKCQTSMPLVRNCPSEPCYNGGTCIDDAFGRITCVCRPGYTGKKCQTPLGL